MLRTYSPLPQVEEGRVSASVIPSMLLLRRFAWILHRCAWILHRYAWILRRFAWILRRFA